MTKTINKTVVFAILLVAILGTSGVLISDAHAAVFAKYDGVDGESTDTAHKEWIDVLSIDWSIDTKQKKKKSNPIAGEFLITMAYEKSSPKILEAITSGKTIPSLEIELTKTVTDPTGLELKVTYLRYELKNVQITSYDVNALSSDLDAAPTVLVGNNFEEIKVTYTEYDDDTGTAKGNVETTWKVGKGEK